MGMKSTEFVGEVVIMTNEGVGQKNGITLARHEVERPVIVALVCLFDGAQVHPVLFAQLIQVTYVVMGSSALRVCI